VICILIVLLFIFSAVIKENTAIAYPFFCSIRAYQSQEPKDNIRRPLSGNLECLSLLFYRLKYLPFSFPFLIEFFY